MASPLIVPPQPLDTVAWVTVRLHASGAISTQGTIGDKAMALHLLDQARDAIKRQVPDGPVLVASPADVSVSPSVPVTEHGDLAPEARGDP